MDVRDGLTTGEFGRRSGLSMKALRLYDVSGLLPPAHVDPFTGHRRYRSDQLEPARRISLLRQLGMPLAVVAEIIAGTDTDALLRLDRWWADQERSMVARRGTLGWLRAQLLGADAAAPAYPVRRRDASAAKIATLRFEVDQQGLLDAVRNGETEIRRHLDAAGVHTTAEHWVLFHGAVTPDSEAPIEVCVPFTGAFEPAGSITIRLEPARTQAYATVSRDDCWFPRIIGAYEAVQAHVMATGAMTAGSVREVYPARWDDIAGSDPFVLVAQPLTSGRVH